MLREENNGDGSNAPQGLTELASWEEVTMLTPLDKLFAACLLGGFAFSALMFLSTGTLRRFHLPWLRFRPRFRRPRLLPRVRLAKPQTAMLAKSLGTGHGPASPSAGVETVLFPPSTLPIFTALLATFFGAIGLLCGHSFHLSPSTSLLTAAIGGVVATVAVAVAVRRYFLVGAAASEVRGGVLLGAMGHISVAIPDGGVGAIAYIAEGKRVTMPARSKHGQALPQRTRVMITDIVGHTAVVEEV